MPRPVQGVLDFGLGDAAGFAKWQRDQEARLEAIRREWGVPVGRRVRVRLKDLDGELKGKLELVSMPATLDRRVPLRLRVDRVEFGIPDIEQLAVLE